MTRTRQLDCSLIHTFMRHLVSSEETLCLWWCDLRAHVHVRCIPVRRTVSEEGREEVATSHFSALKPRQNTAEL